MQNKSVYVLEKPTASKGRRHASVSGIVVLVYFREDGIYYSVLTTCARGADGRVGRRTL